MIQSQVYTALTAQTSGATVKLKSQRGGTEVPIKKFVAWPQHYILVGPRKITPTYDKLDPIQWMAGCLQGAVDLPELDKGKNLQSFRTLARCVQFFI